MKIAVRKITIWHIILVFALLFCLTWWWFDQQLQVLNAQINIHYK